MRRIVCLMLAFLLMLLIGCDNKQPPSKDKDQNSGNNASSAISENNDTSSSDTEDNITSDSNVADDSFTDNMLDVDANSSAVPTRREDRVSLQEVTEETKKAARVGYRLEDAPAFEKVKFGKYVYVWGDEFDGDSIDYDKWYFSNNMLDRENRVLLTEEEDPSIAGVRDGTLQLNARRYTSLVNPNIEFATARALNTEYTMNFKYGYVEMRAKVPLTHGCVPAFWMQSAGTVPKLVEATEKSYFTEVDFFEGWSSSQYVQPGLHKWYTNNCHTNPLSHQCPGYGKYYFSSADQENIREEYHTYGCEWTPEFIKMYVDGNLFCTYDIVTEYDKGWVIDNRTGKKMPEGAGSMAGFHDFADLIITLDMFCDTGDIGTDGSLNSSLYITDEDEMPFEFWIDYVRLYQEPGVGEIVTKN